MATRKTDDSLRVVARNKRARFEYEIIDRYEAGLALLGTEVKSLREGECQITEGHVRFKDDEAWLHGVRIPPYSHAGEENHEPTRPRRLLLKKREIRRLSRATADKGLTVVPLQLYFRGPWAKIEIATARGKKLYDKRQSLRKKQHRRETARALRR